MIKGTIFIGIPAYNEEDLIQTVESCISKSVFPNNLTFGIAMQYTDKNFPDFKQYPNVKVVHIPEEAPYGTSPTRALAASLRRDEEYFLSIDAHTLFKSNWDAELISAYKQLETMAKKPVISTYTPFWYKDVNNKILNQIGKEDLEASFPMINLRFKTLEDQPEDQFIIPSPTWGLEVKDPFIEHHLVSAGFIFSKLSFLDDVPFDTLLPYYEENTTALRAWTRGYRMFAINKDVLWTREMFRGKDTPNSWRQHMGFKDKTSNTFHEKIIKGSLRCKDILTGKILGMYGSPTLALLNEYEKNANIDYVSVYNDMRDRTLNSTPSIVKEMFDLEQELK